MEKILYLECASGISGDMAVASLLDLGADQKVLEQVLGSLPVDGFEVAVSRVKKSGLDACDFSVKLDEAHENHDHDMEYLHGHTHHEHGEHGHTHYECAENSGGVHEYTAHEVSHSHTHAHRGIPEIEKIVRDTEMTEGARCLTMKIFGILAEAEAKAHGVPVNEVHFHEVGAVDSIVDIVAAAVCLDNLGIKKAVVPQLCEGRGFVRCQHGLLPVPVPAVSNIVQAHGLKLHITETEGELVTPTGAAIAAAICTGNHLPERFSIEKIGLGAGKRTYDRPSLLRAMIICPDHTEREQKECGEKDMICRLETNIDDCTGEALGYVMERLLEAGARDVSYTPVFMKKNRPAYQLNVICIPEDAEKLEEIIFRETTTIGIRKMGMERTVLKRQIKKTVTPFGEAEVKECTLPDGTVRCYPEYQSAAALARKKGISIQEAFQVIQGSL
ncbi:MAG: nickel pincer cofactor biosynthesis protein LarC [Eubacteriales bacterium]|nr:nickel pincer cofactor biosynthesis protein LarC [Eubacteriales bacterium]